MTQDRESSENTMATSRSRGDNGEREDTMRVTYHFLFKDEGTQFSRLIVND